MSCNPIGRDFNPKDKTLWFTDNQTDGTGDDIPLGEINRTTQAFLDPTAARPRCAADNARSGQRPWSVT